MAKINVVLFEPEIPQNTGNIMRSCVGFNCKLHLIKPFGFVLDDKHLKRSCVDYIDYVKYEVYGNYEDFAKKNPGKYFFLTRYGHKSPSEIDFTQYEEDIYLIFGKESTGIPYNILYNHLEDCYRIPTTDKIRSLNLSNCAAIMMYLASSQINEDCLIHHEPDTLKGENFIDEYFK